MFMKTAPVKTAILIGLTALLSACTKNPFLVTTSHCPAVAIVSNTGNLTRFAGEDRNASDVVFNASISSISVDCEEGSGIYANIGLSIIATGGPANTESSVSLPYFVALMRDNNLITSKKIYESRLNFNGAQGRAGSRESVVVRFDDIEVSRRYDYEVLIGFQLSPDEVIYNVLR